MRFCPRYNIAIFVDFVVFGLCLKQKQSAIPIAIGGKFPQKVGIFDASFHQHHQIYHNDGIEQSDFYNKLLKNKFILDSDILISFFPSKFLPEHLPKTKGLKFGPRLWPESRNWSLEEDVAAVARDATSLFWKEKHLIQVDGNTRVNLATYEVQKVKSLGQYNPLLHQFELGGKNLLESRSSSCLKKEAAVGWKKK